MANLRYEAGMLKPQDLLFGFDPDLVVPRLTTRNWRGSAIVNWRDCRRIYCFIVKRRLVRDLGGKYVYGLKAVDLDTKERFGPCWWDFPSLQEALAEANQGEPLAIGLPQRRWAEVSLVGVRRPQLEVASSQPAAGDTGPGVEAFEQAFKSLGAHLAGGGSIREGGPGHDLLQQAASTVDWENGLPTGSRKSADSRTPDIPPGN